MVSREMQRYIRYGEIAIVVVLGIIAAMTYRELTQLRKTPVALPNYEFDISSAKEPGDVVQTRGTWISEKGLPEPLQTTTIECRKATLRCVESAAAVVFVEGRGVLESRLTEFEVDRWSNREIVAKPNVDRCGTRTLYLDLTERRARSKVVPRRDEPSRCKEAPERTLDLVAGYKLREQAQ